MIPVAASNGSVKAHVKDVRAEIVDGTLRMHISYEFNGTKVNNLKDSRSIKTLPPGFRAKSGRQSHILTTGGTAVLQYPLLLRQTCL